jgi:hypothetical protein
MRVGLWVNTCGAHHPVVPRGPLACIPLVLVELGKRDDAEGAFEV